MRISGGTHCGRLVIVPKDAELRPTTERVREAMFSSLFSMGVIEQARTLDLFAGSGLLGLESLSRGASRAVFVENDRKLVKLLDEHLQNFGFAARGKTVCSEVDKFLASSPAQYGGAFDLILADPPYAEHPGERLLELLLKGGWVKPGSVVVVESGSKSVQFPESVAGNPAPSPESSILSLSLQKVKRYGDTEVATYLTT